MPEKTLLSKLRKRSTPTHRISVTLTAALHAKMVRCMELEGNLYTSEFAAVAIMRRCREIEESLAPSPVTGKKPL